MRIAVVTTSRADYSHLYWPLKGLHAHPDIDLNIIAMASHLSPEFGRTVREIEADGLPIAAKLECLLSSDTDVGMAKSIGLGVLALADTLSSLRPDILLLIADRYEMLAPASVALALRIPIAHIEGGEMSEGAIDDAVRNALTKMSHVHFTSTFRARERVISMGEEPWRVHRAGAPSLDHLKKSKLFSQQEMEERLAVKLSVPTIVVAFHPVTLLSDTVVEADALYAALGERTEQLIFCYPNADAGSRSLVQQTERFLAARGNGKLFVNLPAVEYWSLLQFVRMMIGNSSSGIMETASFALPTINVGLRQKGRERPRNVIDVIADAKLIGEAIEKALSLQFSEKLLGMDNPYGEGVASERIVDILTHLPGRNELLMKHAGPLELS
jgi:UDP-N-acetylglucosamine 2-epimerase (non-hydrolysing)/GDP/UDP-N,N'-diacetylbacillosamine 2-epimerase (hydrolysing)